MGELEEALLEAGLTRVAIVAEHDSFRGTSKERIARKYGVIGVDVIAYKPSASGGRG